MGHESKDEVPVMNALEYFMGANFVKIKKMLLMFLLLEILNYK